MPAAGLRTSPSMRQIWAGQNGAGRGGYGVVGGGRGGGRADGRAGGQMAVKNTVKQDSKDSVD